MKAVATIIAGESFNLNQQEADSIIDALSHNGAIIENIEWLSKDKALDIFFAVLSIEEVRELLSALLQNFDVDFIVQPISGRRKKLLISDMDSTIINQECIDELADCLGLKPQISAITEKAMNGELDFKEALRERVGLLKGLAESQLQEVYNTRITFMKGTKSLVQTMKTSGAKCVLVSGGFTFFTNRVREEIGFDIDESNILEIENGKLTGIVREPILDSTSKLNALLFYCEELGISPFMSCAVGDGANDLPMILKSGLGIAFHAKEKVRKAATHNINIPNLKHILYAQGYKDSEIIE
jgi:phosphoserine phosphatase